MCIAASFTIAMLSICALMLVRNEIVFRARQRAIVVSHKRALASIENGDLEWERHYAEYDSRSYALMLVSITKWTFAQFYPGLEGERS